MDLPDLVPAWTGSHASAEEASEKYQDKSYGRLEERPSLKPGEVRECFQEEVTG